MHNIKQLLDRVNWKSEMMSSISKFVLEGREASCSSFLLDVVTRFINRDCGEQWYDVKRNQELSFIISILMSDTSFENCKELATENIRYVLEVEIGYLLEIWMCCWVLSQCRWRWVSECSLLYGVYRVFPGEGSRVSGIPLLGYDHDYNFKKTKWSRSFIPQMNSTRCDLRFWKKKR